MERNFETSQEKRKRIAFIFAIIAAMKKQEQRDQFKEQNE